jgi:hypothetical protein
VVLGKSDKEISDFFRCDRSTIRKLREKYGIKPRVYTGEKGEYIAQCKLAEIGLKVENMNLKYNKTYQFDLLVNGITKIEVKSSKLCSKTAKRKSFNFVFDNNSNSDMKDYSKSCDFIILVCIEENENIFFVIPSGDIQGVKRIDIYKNITPRSRYYTYKEKWDLLKEK